LQVRGIIDEREIAIVLIILQIKKKVPMLNANGTFL